MENLIYGTDSLTRLSQVQQSVASELAAGGFAVREWASNYPDCLQNWAPEDRCDQPVVKVLGYLYNIQKYTLQLKLPSPDSKVSTRRCILSQIFQIFEPLGFQNPFSFVLNFYSEFCILRQRVGILPYPQMLWR